MLDCTRKKRMEPLCFILHELLYDGNYYIEKKYTTIL